MKYTLTDASLTKAKTRNKAYKLADGGGLYVLVSTTGTKSWRYNYKFNGSYKTLALGTFPAISIKAARSAHAEAIEMIADGGDPAGAKQVEQAKLDDRPTFRQVASEWQKLFPESKRAPKTWARDCRNIKVLNMKIGDKVMADLRVKHLADVLNVLEEAGKFSTRAKVQATAKSIAGFAVGRGIIEFNPFSEIKWAAAYTSCVHTPRPAVTDPVQFGTLMRKIDHFEGHDGNITGIGLKLLALTAVRPGELTAAKWRHFDFDDAVWAVPPEELKMRTKRQKANSVLANKAHQVPLARQTIALLRQLRAITGESEYLFPGRQSARTMSENTLNYALHALGYKGVHCAHGFRSSFSTRMNEEFIEIDGREVYLWEKQDALIEMQLDHDDPSTRAIYARGGRWKDRAKLMQHWADLIDRLRSGNPSAKKPRLAVVA